MSDDPSERQTRKKRIDPMLKAAGWRVVPHDPDRPLSDFDRCAIEEYSTDSGPADYALCVDGAVIGIVEAKKLTLGPQNALTQAERYSNGVSDSPFNFRGYNVPFLYSTNGEAVWHHDIRHELNRSRQTARFHTPAALREFLNAEFETATEYLLSTPDDNKFLRPYQREANAAVEQSIADRKRSMLVAMATGTGKTYTMVNQVYRLMKSGLAKRILFLVDRRALAAQAVRAFNSFEPEPGLKFNQIYEVYSNRFQREDFSEDDPFDPKVLPQDYLTDPQPGHAFVYICTIQRMTINLFGREAAFAYRGDPLDEDAGTLDIPIHAFDVIIADECHRGYTSRALNVWRSTLNHFDAIKIGLTATPAVHTTTYFKDIPFRYDYERAVHEGHLVDYDVVAVKSDVRLNGVFLEEGEQVGIIDSETGAEQMDLLEDEREFDATEVERKVISPDSNRKILEELRIYAAEHEERTGRFPKTLIFAANDVPHTSHADALVDLACDVFGRGESFVRKITGKVDRPLQRIREFRNRKEPAIAVTVDLLSTGVDIPDLEYIVFLRPVKSRILFEQMLGRGTRKGERFPDKGRFVVFDCFDGTLLEYFRDATGVTAELPQAEYKSIPEIIEEIWQNIDRQYNTRRLAKRLHRIDREMSGDARELFAAYIPHGDLGRFAKDLWLNLKDDFTGTMELLRDRSLQDLLENYPRPKRGVVVAPGVVDVVSSAWVVRGTNGTEYKPEDYIQAFARFVKENPERIAAIGILLEHPRDWSADALSELQDKLKRAPQRFTVDNLQKAHEVHYKKALVDIISMVKHAAVEEAPLLTAAERVDRAFERITAGQAFSDKQKVWLDRIRHHLINNLSIEKDDFESVQVFTRHGGWRVADRVFEGKLIELIKRFNEAVAA